LAPKRITKKKVTLAATDLTLGIGVLKTVLLKKGSATENFAQERNRRSLEGIVGNVVQTFDGVALYPSIESRRLTCYTPSSRTIPLSIATSGQGPSPSSGI